MLRLIQGMKEKWTPCRAHRSQPQVQLPCWGLFLKCPATEVQVLSTSVPLAPSS